jgi:hypothetical protein
LDRLDDDFGLDTIFSESCKLLGLRVKSIGYMSCEQLLAGATTLHKTGNYHASITIVCVIAIIGLIFAQFLKPPQVFCTIEHHLSAEKVRKS